MATFEEYQAKLKGVQHVPLLLLISELEHLKIYPDDIESATDEQAFYYRQSLKYIPAAHKFDYYEDGSGIIGYWLKEGLDVSKAVLKVSLLLMKAGAEKLYTRVQVKKQFDNREIDIYIFTAVAQFKEIP